MGKMSRNFPVGFEFFRSVRSPFLEAEFCPILVCVHIVG